MPSEGVDRRRARRRVPASTESLSRVRLRAGRELRVVDIAPTGALLEGRSRLLPGTHVEVHVTTGRGRTLERAAVVRSWVSGLGPDEVRYRGAVAFCGVVDVSPPGGA
jgi:hypothetical protein